MIKCHMIIISYYDNLYIYQPPIFIIQVWVQSLLIVSYTSATQILAYNNILSNNIHIC